MSAPDASRPLRLGLAVTAALLVAMLAAVAASRRGATTDFRTFTGEAMATRWQVELPDRPGSAAAAEECLDLFTRLDLELSEWKEGSPLSAVNRAAGERPVEVPQELFDLVARSVEIARETDGAFDPSWAALWGLWDFRSETPRPPDADEVARRVRLVDFRRIALDPEKRTIFLPEKGMLLGLGAIGKGFALDRAAERLEARGFRDFLLVGGGQVLARGRKGERPWRIGVRDPRGAPDEVFARIDVSGASLSTSADNESFFVVDGVRYHHILDPRTGWPSQGLRSVTVVHPDGTLADALSTAVMVLGRERGMAVARRLGAELLLVDDQGRVSSTPGLAPRLELLATPRRD